MTIGREPEGHWPEGGTEAGRPMRFHWNHYPPKIQIGAEKGDIIMKKDLIEVLIEGAAGVIEAIIRRIKREK